MSDTQWLVWVEKIRAIAQNGLTYTKEGYDLERYHQLQAIAHEMTAALAGAPKEKADDFFLPEKGYCTPKVDLRAGVFKGGKILLVKERSDNCWALPGGWGDVCEPPSLGAEREVLEESGFIVNARKLVAVRDTHRHPYHPYNPHHIYKMLFLCDLTGGEAKTNLEISDIAFFPPDQLPELSQGRTIAGDIEMLCQHLSNPLLPAEFD